MNKELSVAIDESFTVSTRFTVLKVRVICLAFLCALVDGLDFQVIAYAAPEMAKEIGLHAASLGIVFSAGSVGLAAGAMLLAPMGDHWGRKTVILLSLFLFGGCVVATLLAETTGELVALRLLTGLGIGGVMPNAIAISMEFSPSRHRGVIVSLTYFGFIIGAALGGVAAVTVIPMMGWKGLFFIAGGLPLLLALLIFFALPESPQYLEQRRRGQEDIPTRRGGSAKGTFLREWKGFSSVSTIFLPEYRRNTILMWTSMFANVFSVFAVVQWLPSILSRTGMPLEKANLLVGLLWLSAIAGVLLLLYHSRRIRLQRVLAAYLCIGGVVTMLLGVTISGSVTGSAMLALLIGYGMTGAGAQIGFYSLLANIYPASVRVTGIGLAQGMGRLGTIGGPAIVGFLFTMGISDVYVFLFLAVPLLVAAVAVWNVTMSHAE